MWSERLISYQGRTPDKKLQIFKQPKFVQQFYYRQRSKGFIKNFSRSP
jgi:hypothetical protein